MIEINFPNQLHIQHRFQILGFSKYTLAKVFEKYSTKYEYRVIFEPQKRPFKYTRIGTNFVKTAALATIFLPSEFFLRC